jgi:hypothetical protein
MKKVLHRIFGFSDDNEQKENQRKHNPGQGEQNPDPDIPKNFNELDEEFAYHFTQQGGKFIYCGSHEELMTSLTAVCQQWNLDHVSCHEQSVRALLSTLPTSIQVANVNQSDAFVCNCENLIASDGRIMVTSIQTGYTKVKDLPEKVIVLAKTSQLVKNMGEGLTQINFRHKKNIPGQITCIRNKNEQSSGIERPNDKHVFILMIEDYNPV